MYTRFYRPEGCSWNDILNTSTNIGEKINDVFIKMTQANSPKLDSILVCATEEGEVISAGGVELIAVGVLLTNYDCSSMVRGKALLQHLINMKLTCSRLHQDYLHVFENGHDEIWIKALKAYDFKPAGNAFFKKVS